jgi:hypothetical protein
VKQLVETEVYEIRKQDDWNTRINELSEFTSLTPQQLDAWITSKVTKQMGSAYMKEFKAS